MMFKNSYKHLIGIRLIIFSMKCVSCILGFLLNIYNGV